MPYRGWKTITVSEEVERDLKAIWQADKNKPKAQSFTNYIDNLLADFVNYQKRLEEYGAFLKYEGADENRISVFDSFLGQVITLWVDGKAKRLKCAHHKMSDSCIHVGFCYGVKEIYKVLIDAGFKPPKRIEG